MLSDALFLGPQVRLKRTGEVHRLVWHEQAAQMLQFAKPITSRLRLPCKCLLTISVGMHDSIIDHSRFRLCSIEK